MDDLSSSIEREPSVELNIRFSGTPEQAARLVKVTKAWGVIFRASSGISIEFGSDITDEGHDPYVSVNELIEYAAESSEFNTVGTRVSRALDRYAVRNPDKLDGTPVRTERSGLPYFHEDFLRLVSYNADAGEIPNLGKKSSALIDSFFEQREKTQLETE